MLENEPYEIFKDKPFTCYRGILDTYLYLVHTQEEWEVLFTELMKRPRISCDLETESLRWFAGDKLCGISFGWGVHNFYCTFRHKNSELGGVQPSQLDIDVLRPQIQQLFSRKDLLLIGHNFSKFDRHFFKADNIDINCGVHDTLLMWKLLDQEAPGALKDLSSGWRDLMGFWHQGIVHKDANKDEKLISEWRTKEAKARKAVFQEEVLQRLVVRQSEIRFQGWKKNDIKKWVIANDMTNHKYYEKYSKDDITYDYVPIVDMTKYAALDTFLAYKVYEYCLPKIQENPKLTALYKNELKLSKVLWNVERRGVYIDIPYLQKVEKDFDEELKIKAKVIQEQLGKINVLQKKATKTKPEVWGLEDVSITSNDQLAQAFINNLGIELTDKTKSGKFAMDKKVLSNLAREHKICKEILDFRKLEKLQNTYVRNILNSVVDVPDDKILHSNYSQQVACLPIGELVLTDRGYIPVEDVRVGDSVISHTGNTNKVVDTSIHPPSIIYKIETESGLVLRTTGNHPYYCDGTWINAEDLIVGQEVTCLSSAEKWQDIQDWHPFEVSCWGRVRNKITKNILTNFKKNSSGHLKVLLTRNGAQKRGKDRKDFTIHRLVAKAFLGQQSKGLEVRHLDGVGWHNDIKNLRYGTSIENKQDNFIHGLFGNQNSRINLSTEDINKIRNTVLIRRQHLKVRSQDKIKLFDTIREEFLSKQVSQQYLAKKYKMSYGYISCIVKGKYRKDVNFPENTNTITGLAKKYNVSRATIKSIISGKYWDPENHKIKSILDHFYTCKITNIIIEKEEISYGLEVENDHSHITGGIVTHNTGRMSSSGLGGSGINFQNIPGKSDVIRKAFVCPGDPDYLYFLLDYSQVEVRLTAHFSQDPILLEGFRNNLDVHLRTSCNMFGMDYDESFIARHNKSHPKHVEVENIRKYGKILNFAAIYQVGPSGLSDQIPKGEKYQDYSREQWIAVCAQFLEKYFEVHRAVKKLIIRSNRFIRKNGYFENTFGRRRILPHYNATKKLKDTDKAWLEAKAQRQGTNFGVQGEAGDIFKYSMNRVDDLLKNTKSGIVNAVHDELQLYIHKNDVHLVPRIKEEMERWDYSVPLVVDVSVSTNSWGEKDEVKDPYDIEALLKLYEQRKQLVSK